jgi:alpha-L-glutamate ligase-like protein
MVNPFSRYGHEVLSLNARTLQYTNRTNVQQAIRLANNKLESKRLLQKAGVGVPRLYATITSRSELKRFRWTKLPPSFVLKPNSSSGGGGIIVIFGRNRKGNWVKADKTEVFIPELKNRVLDILDGDFSRSNIPDIAFFEQRVRNHPDLKPYSVKGVPDIRVLVYNHFPVMAMLRLPTEESGGRANLHAGGIGVGIDLKLGLTTTAIQYGQPLEFIPGKRLSLSGIRIPHWPEVLLTAVRAAEAIDLTFGGVDVTVDRDDGPVVLEINARPGLDIQLANMAPLRSRLHRVEGLKITRPEKAIVLAQSLFGSDVDQEIEEVSGRVVLGIEETIQVFTNEGEAQPIVAKVDTGAWRTTLDEALAKKYSLHKPVIEERPVRGALGEDTRPVVELTMKIRDRIIKTNAFIADRSHMNYDMIIGRRDLKGFLVDPYKRLKKEAAQTDLRSV